MKRLSEISKVHHCVFMLAIIVFGFERACAESEQPKPLNDARPLWEAGVGGFAGSVPDYPAAGQNTFHALTLPYLIYRGDILRVGGEENRGAISGRFINNDRFELDLSLSAAFPVDSSSNSARRDMPDLDFLFGIGPQLIFKLAHESGHSKLNFNLQLRSIFSTDFSSIDHRGYVFNPQLYYTREHVTGLDLNVFTSMGPVFATEKLMDYFYEVDTQYVTPSRRAYDADAGYLGSNMTFAVSRQFSKRFRLILGTWLGLYHGATNDDSPLFMDKLNLGVFTAFTWSFKQSVLPAR